MVSVVNVRGVSYEFTNGRQLFSNLNFALDDGLSALVGPNGVGKTCLARLLAGELEPTAGVIQRNSPIKLFPQRQEPDPITLRRGIAVFEVFA